MASQKIKLGVKKPQRITVETKKEIIAKHENGARVTDLGRQYGMAKSTICTILKNKDAIKAADVAEGVTILTKQRSPVIEKVEKLLIVWIQERRLAGDRVTVNQICKKALLLHELLVAQSPSINANRVEFKGSRGWFANFRRRLGIKKKHGSNSNNNRSSSGNVPRSLANKQLEQNTTLISGDSDWPFDNFQSEMDASTSQNYLNPSSSSPSINSYNLNAQNSTIDTKPITVNHADIKKQQLEFLEAQMHQADVEAKKRQAEAKKRQAELAEAKKLAEKLAEEERLRKEAENKVYKYMVLNHEKKVLETLRALWKGNQFCDATLQNEFISIPVHKIVLIACCPKILETYDYIMKDTNVQVCFPRKVTAEALKAFVDYLYNGSLNLSRAILESMEYLSGMLGLDEIRQLCNQFRSDMLNDSFGIPDKTIVHVNNPHEHSSHQMSYNDHIVPPPPIVRPSTHSVAAPTAVSIQLSNFQDATPVTSVHSNNFNLFSEPHADSVLTEVSHIKLEPEPEVDLTAEDCTEIKQESLQSQLYEDANCKFEEWPSTVVEPHHPPPPPPPPPSSSSSLSQPNFVQRNKNNFEMSTVDLSLTPLNAFQKQTSNNISRNISSGVITISPSNSPCPSPGLAESPSDIQTLQISNTHTISTTNTNPFPVSLISTNGQSISLTDQDNKRKHFADFDSKDDRKRSKIILN